MSGAKNFRASLLQVRMNSKFSRKDIYFRICCYHLPVYTEAPTDIDKFFTVLYNAYCTRTVCITNHHTYLQGGIPC